MQHPLTAPQWHNDTEGRSSNGGKQVLLYGDGKGQAPAHAPLVSQWVLVLGNNLLSCCEEG